MANLLNISNQLNELEKLKRSVGLFNKISWLGLMFKCGNTQLNYIRCCPGVLCAGYEAKPHLIAMAYPQLHCPALEVAKREQRFSCGFANGGGCGATIEAKKRSLVITFQNR